MSILDSVGDRESLIATSKWILDIDGEQIIKGVVDVDKELLAVDADMHADLEQLLLDNGSNQGSLWGINLHISCITQNFIEFDSLINLRPWQSNRTRGIDNSKLRDKITEVVYKWVHI